MTQGSGDDGVLGSNGFPIYLSNLPTTTIRTVPARVGISGLTIATAQARVDSDLAAAVGYPDFVFVNLGKNDVKNGASAPVQATVESNLAYILDACHVKWPLARVYLAKIQALNDNGYLTALDDTWIPNVLASRSAWAFVGPDERTFLSAGNMVDNLHPNHAGHVLLATNVRTTAGY